MLQWTTNYARFCMCFRRLRGLNHKALDGWGEEGDLYPKPASGRWIFSEQRMLVSTVCPTHKLSWPLVLRTPQEQILLLAELLLLLGG